jgi:hypothetical protein
VVLQAPRLVSRAASRRLLERQGFRITDPLRDTDDVRYTLSLA